MIHHDLLRYLVEYLGAPLIWGEGRFWGGACAKAALAAGPSFG